VQRADVGDTMTLTMILLLAWLPLSALLALLVGACIRFGSGELDPLPAPKSRSKPQKILEPASA